MGLVYLPKIWLKLTVNIGKYHGASGGVYMVYGG